MNNTRPVMFGVGFVLVFTAINVWYSVEYRDFVGECSYVNHHTN